LQAALSVLGGASTSIELPVQTLMPTPKAVDIPPKEPASAPPKEVVLEAPAPTVAKPDRTPASSPTCRTPPANGQPWLSPKTKAPLAKEKWTGKVREVTIGATKEEGGTRATTVTVGGQSAMPFMDFEGAMPHPPVVAIEIRDRKPEDWSSLLLEAWGDVVEDPASWAKAAEQTGASLIQLGLGLDNTPETAIATVKSVLAATGLPVAVIGPGQAEKDNELLVPVADACKGERLLLGICEDKNYRTIVASALANGHLVSARTAMDVNLAKQLNILINDLGLPMDRVIMDPTTGALGYGFEYGYSVMERLRLAALQGDSMTQLPMMVTPGEECWKTKEAKVGSGVPEEWGDWRERAITWETLTSVMLIESGADIVSLRHPETVKRVKMAIGDLAHH